jgi:hypothetical protein
MCSLTVIGNKASKELCFDVDPVFENSNRTMGSAFMLRGKEKVEIEWGLPAIAQKY